ncbi:MAG TPA: hypothetical protein P5060_00015 [Candidatus Absconditabacterales bacterium]|nr:hypothetical protein [Candidatus Absconditabacterales bacterium]
MNINKLESLKVEFPFLKELFEKEYKESHSSFLKGDKRFIVNVDVQRMDSSLMYFTGDYLNGTNGALLKKGFVGSLCYDLYFIDSKNAIIKSQKKRDRDAMFIMRALELIAKITKEDLDVSTIVKVETTKWYKPDDNGNADYKTFQDEKINVVIYKEPKEGLNTFLSARESIIDAEMTPDLLIKLMCKQPEKYKVIEDRFNIIKKRFKSLFEMYLQSFMYEHRAFKFKIGDISFRSLSMAGRLLITLEKGEAQVTYAAVDQKEGDCRMGSNGFNGTIAEIEQITNTVIFDLLEYFGSGKTPVDIMKTGKVGYAGHVFG